MFCSCKFRYLVKEQIIKSATEAASVLLRIDNVIAASKSKTPSIVSAKHELGNRPCTENVGY
jgi:chaperonin GroEL (HSP60 family)